MLILLVDNSIEMATMLQQMLELEGHEVLVGRSGREGLRLLQENSALPDMILSDLAMQDMDGFEFLAHVRQHPSWMPLIFIAVSGNLAEAERAVDLGANDYLDKPFRIQKLRELLKKWQPTQ
ncbi:MAG: response regulator [Anaerolineae bacterium]